MFICHDLSLYRKRMTTHDVLGACDLHLGEPDEAKIKAPDVAFPSP